MEIFGAFAESGLLYTNPPLLLTIKRCRKTMVAQERCEQENEASRFVCNKNDRVPR